MGYGPKLTPKQKVKLEAEIRSFNKKKTLIEIEKNAVGKRDIDAYSDSITFGEDRTNKNQKINEHVRANPDSIIASGSPNEMYKPDLQILSAKLEINDILSFRQRQVWQACMREGLSAEQAGIRLNLNTRTVESYLKAAIKKVKAHFNAD